MDKKLYKEIKKLNRKELNDYISNVYRTGFTDGSNASSNVDFKIEVSKLLKVTKGIGDKLYDRIMSSIK